MPDWLGGIGGYSTFDSYLASPNPVFRVSMKIPEFFWLFSNVVEYLFDEEAYHVTFLAFSGNKKSLDDSQLIETSVSCSHHLSSARHLLQSLPAPAPPASA